MKLRKLGNSGIEVGPLALGGNVFGWTADEPTSFAILDAFVAAGFNLIDTADMYSVWVPGHQGGESETIIGKWLAHSGRRSQVVIATKVGMELTPSDKGLSKPYILRAVERSLQRLQTDYIDLYQSHLDDQSTPLDETLSAYDQLIKQGEGTCDRRVELYRLAAGRSAAHEPRERLSPLRMSATALQPVRASAIRERSRTSLPGGGPGGDPVFLAGSRISDGQISVRTGPFQEPTRPRVEEISQRTRVSDSGSRRSGRQPPGIHTG